MEKTDIYEILKHDPSIDFLFTQDPDSKVYISLIEKNAYEILTTEYPTLFSGSFSSVYAVNAISTRMFPHQSYLKLKMYISLEGKILKKITNFEPK